MRELVERIQDEQRSCWQRGDRVPVEDYLGRYPTLKADATAAVDLIYGEVLLREELGEAPTADEYLHRFTEYAEPLRRQLRLHEWLRTSPVGASETPPSHLTGTEKTLPMRPAPARDAAETLPAIPGYEILGRLGKGGRGIVYRARQIKLDRIVALKMIRPDDDLDPGAVELFRREAKAVARLEHPNIIRLYDFEEHAGRPYFTMELAAGGSLEERLEAGPLGPREAAALVATLARAVHAVHRQEQGIAHRDLKPANVLFDDAGVPKVADFGLAKRLGGRDSLFPSGAIVGTVNYMAPEQAAGAREVGPAADVWALGAILYECLTGRPPFKAATLLDTLDKVRFQEPAPPRRARVAIPRALEAICLECLRKEPQQRYPSAEALAEDLTSWLAGKQSLARPAGMLHRSWHLARRHPRKWVGVLAVTLALVAWFVGHFGATETRLEAASQHLASGRPVTWIGESGQPLWFQCVLGEDAVLLSKKANRPFGVTTLSTALVELLPRVPIQRYRVTAKVLHDDGAILSTVGFYFGHVSYQTPRGACHFFYELSFSDRLPGGLRQHLSLHLRQWGEGEPVRTRGPRFSFLFADTKPLPRLSSDKADWREVSVELSPEGIRVWENGQPIGEMSRERLAQQASVWLRRFSPGGVNYPVWPIQEGFGLYVQGGTGLFQSVKVTPLMEHTEEASGLGQTARTD